MKDKTMTTRFLDAYDSSPDHSHDRNHLGSRSDSATNYLSEETSDGVDQTAIDGEGRASHAGEFFGGNAVLERGGLVAAKRFEIECFGLEKDIAEINISGLPQWMSTAAKKRRDRGVLRECIWAPKGIEVFLTTPVPADNPLRNS